MNDNSKVATPVNLAGMSPGFPALPVDATIVAPLPLPVLPVGPTYNTKQQFITGGAFQTAILLSAVACELQVIAGYSNEPTPNRLLWLQLFDLNVLPTTGVTNPQVIIPVYGLSAPFSFGMQLEFFDGLAVGLSLTETVYTRTDPDAWLAFSAIWKIAP
jgi:hypothetical protein